MESHEVLKNAIGHVGVKQVAGDLNLSTSLVYKWCQANQRVEDSGADNPLDRLLQVYESTGDPRVINWICEKADGFFVKKPEQVGSIGSEVFNSTQKILKEFSDLLEVVSQSYSNDQQIDGTEAERIREAWETLKSIGETFVFSCEAGLFEEKDPDCP
ncbi:MAG: phage regulatory CII family protein [Opitutaceae bacterium]